MAISMETNWEKILLPSIRERIRQTIDKEVALAVAEIGPRIRRALIDEGLDTAITISRYMDKTMGERLSVDIRLAADKGISGT